MLLSSVPQAAPATLKAAFLEPMSSDLASSVMLELFARTDGDFMAMFTGAHSRVEGQAEEPCY